MDMQYLLPAAATLTAGFASVALAGLKTYLDERTHASRLSIG